MMTFNDEPKKSNMRFSCGPNEQDRKVVLDVFYKEDDDGCHTYKMTAPVHVRLKDINGVFRLQPVYGPVVFIASGEEFWGGGQAKDFRSKVVVNPTYRALMGAAKSSQKVTRDYHHQFIEGAYFKGYEGTTMILQMSFGS